MSFKQWFPWGSKNKAEQDVPNTIQAVTPASMYLQLAGEEEEKDAGARSTAMRVTAGIATLILGVSTGLSLVQRADAADSAGDPGGDDDGDTGTGTATGTGANTATATGTGTNLNTVDATGSNTATGTGVGLPNTASASATARATPAQPARRPPPRARGRRRDGHWN